MVLVGMGRYLQIGHDVMVNTKEAFDHLSTVTGYFDRYRLYIEVRE